MTAVILAIFTLVVISLTIVVLLQRSEGGALGMGGGGGGLMSGRGAANVLTRTTSVLGAAFYVLALAMAILSDRGESVDDIRRETLGIEIDAAGEADPTDAGDLDASDILDLGTGNEADIQQEQPITFPDPAEGTPPAADDDADGTPDPQENQPQ